MPNQASNFGKAVISLKDTEYNIQSLFNVEIIPCEDEDDIVEKTYITAPKVTSGRSHNVVLKADGTVWNWGRKSVDVTLTNTRTYDKTQYFTMSLNLGVVGSSSGDYVNYPIQVIRSDGKYLTDVVDVAASGYASFAVDAQGRVWVWGNHFAGQSGVDYTTAFNRLCSARQLALPAGQKAIRVVAALNAVYVLTESGLVYSQALGSASTSGLTSHDSKMTGAAGLNSQYSRNGYLNHIVDLDANTVGGGVSYLRRDGAIFHDNNILGKDAGIASEDNFRRNVVGLARGNGYTLLLRDDNSISAYGTGSNGALLSATASAINAPVIVNGADVVSGTAVSFTGGDNLYIFNLFADGDTSAVTGKQTGGNTMENVLYVWGNTSNLGAVNSATSVSVPTAVYTGYNSEDYLVNADQRLVKVADMAMGGSQAIYMTYDGKVWVSGDNSYGQRGDQYPYGQYRSKDRPVRSGDEDMDILVMTILGDETRFLTLEEGAAQVLALVDAGQRLKDAAREVAEHTGLSKNDLYAAALEARK